MPNLSVRSCARSRVAEKISLRFSLQQGKLRDPDRYRTGFSGRTDPRGCAPNSTRPLRAGRKMRSIFRGGVISRPPMAEPGTNIYLPRNLPRKFRPSLPPAPRLRRTRLSKPAEASAKAARGRVVTAVNFTPIFPAFFPAPGKRIASPSGAPSHCRRRPDHVFNCQRAAPNDKPIWFICQPHLIAQALAGGATRARNSSNSLSGNSG